MANRKYPDLTPGQSYTDSNGGEKLGISFKVTEPTLISGFHFYSPVVYPDRVLELFVDGVLSQAVHSAVVVGDNFIPFTTPLQAVVGPEYVVAVATYSTTGGQFDGAVSDYTAVNYENGGTSGPFVFGPNPGRYADQSVTPSSTLTTTSKFWYGIGVYVADAVVVPPSPTPVTVTASASPTSIQVGGGSSLTAEKHDGSGSATFAWTQLSGPAVTITASSSAIASVTPSQSGQYEFQVTVTDSTGSDSDQVALTVTAAPVNPTDPTPTPGEEYELWVKDPDGGWHLINSPSSAPAKRGVFYLEDFGAVGDGVTDDTKAWNDCVAAAVAAAPQYNYSVIVEGQSSEYLIATPPVKGRNYGNAQISIPHVPANQGRKITLTFRGPSLASTFLHWDQSAAQSMGLVLHSTFSSGSYDSTWGVPSILGGPTNLSSAPQDQFATFSNMHIVIEGISTLQPAGASLIGFDFRRIGQASVPDAGSFSNRSRKTNPPIETLTNNDQSVGLVMPFKGNNARSEIGSYTAEGLYSGLIASEHLIADYVGVIYCRRALQLAGLTNGDWPNGQRRIGDHSIHIGRLLAEAVDYWVYNDSVTTQLVVDSMGGEGTTNFVAHVYDSISGENGRGGLTGRINLMDIFQQYPVVEGNTSLRIINDGVLPGAAYSTPNVPSSGTALRNPFWRDATVAISGGSVSSIKVEGVELGVTSGLIPLATGQRITITYSSAPTWRWLLS
jgi:hypothetical protein